MAHLTTLPLPQSLLESLFSNWHSRFTLPLVVVVDVVFAPGSNLLSLVQILDLVCSLGFL